MNLDFFREKIISQYGQNVLSNVEAGMGMRCPSFRVNTIKATTSEIEETLNANNIDFIRSKWYVDAYILKNSLDESKIRELSIYEEGKIYMQSLSSMIPAIVVNPKAGENILDMCAAPGGKTIQMAALSDNGALITACERNKIRCDRLKYNILKQGAKSINVLNQDSIQLSDYFSFDKILLDAPCSGSGTILLDSPTNGEITEEYVNKLVKVQRKLLDKALKILKKGGTLVYSTCSIFKEENEENISYVLNKYKDIQLEPISDIVKYSNIKLLPVKHDETVCIQPNIFYEGFFIAKIKKS